MPAYIIIFQYQQKFSTRLSSRNLLHIKQLLFFLSCLLKALGISMKSKNSSLDSCIQQTEEKVFDPINFSVEVGFDHLNMHKVFLLFFLHDCQWQFTTTVFHFLVHFFFFQNIFFLACRIL